MDLVRPFFRLWPFWLGFFLRLLACLFLSPMAQNVWFVPFFDAWLADPTPIPWNAAAGLDARVFPYGPVMFLSIAPLCLLGIILAPLGFNPSVFAVRGAIFSADFILLLLLAHLFPRQERKLLALYWFSPLVLLANYWAGQLDVIPTVWLTAACLALRDYRFRVAGALAAAAAAAKLSVAVVFPFLILFLFRNRRFVGLRSHFIFTFSIVVALGLGLPLLTASYHRLVMGTAEMSRFLDFHLLLGDIPLFLTPIIYGCAIYVVAHIHRISFDLLLSLVGCALLTILLTTRTPPAWYIWFVPFLTAHALRVRLQQSLPVFLFVLTSSMCQYLFWPSPIWLGLDNYFTPEVWLEPRLIAICYSVNLFAGIILLADTLRRDIFNNDIYQIGQKPVSIAIAGNSGVGKDRCARLMADLLGEDSVVQISGDDYHNWDRFGLMWKRLTHLSPKANQLERFAADVLSVLERKRILCRIYDHHTGRFKQQIYRRVGDFVIISGLHALYQEKLNAKFDLKVFLDMDERLRIFFKCRRDVVERGHSLERVMASIEKRRADAALHIAPQAQSADIVFRLEPLPGSDLGDYDVVPKLRLKVSLRRAMYVEALTKQLVVMGRLNVLPVEAGEFFEQSFLIEGNSLFGQVGAIAQRLIPGLGDILAPQPGWREGLDGVIQLIFLCHLTQNCKEERG
jgi:uridine kinase